MKLLIAALAVFCGVFTIYFAATSQPAAMIAMLVCMWLCILEVSR